jgi:hypothetical protein
MVRAATVGITDGLPAPKPATSLVEFPVEILQGVFESLDSFDTAIALASTCKLFGDIYKTNKPWICLRILRYDPVLQGTTMSFYEKAVRLFEAQQKTVLERQDKEVKGEHSTSGTR